MSHTEIRINASTPYTVHIGHGLLKKAGEMVAAVSKPCTAAIVTDSNVAPLYLETVEASLKEAGFATLHYIFPAGEESKNLTTFGNILEFLAENHLTRSDLIVALGGGVTGDMAGFTAASYARGIRYVQMPTTLLSAVDSSVGGKTAVDLKAGKNLVGAFKQPLAVICDVDALNTLTDEVFADGSAECIKYGVLQSERILEIFEKEDPHACIEEVIAESVKIKADYVARDEFDTGDRAFLNLGHTIGHAIERSSNFDIMHGHGVGAGMAMISRAGEKLGLTEAGTTARLEEILKRNDLPVTSDYPLDILLEGALSDKKRAGSNITLVMVEKMGKCFLHKVPVEDLANIIELSR